MKLCTFAVSTPIGRRRRLGAVRSGVICDLNFATAWYLEQQGEPEPQRLANALVPDNMLEFLEAGTRALHTAEELFLGAGPHPSRWWELGAGSPRGPNDETLVYRPEEVRLCAPLPNPRSVRDFFAFEAHVKAGFEKRGEPMPPEWYEIPVYYKSGRHHIIGTDEDVRWPSFTEKFDYELELAAVIGRRARNVQVGDARKCIAGYMIMNDFSARDIQRKEMKVRLGPAKGKDWCTAFGPLLLTPDEVGDPYKLVMTARVNGEEWSRGNSSSMHWKFEQMIEFLSLDDTVLPGDVIGSGTVGGGCGLELDRWVKRGDVIELEIDKLGILRNRVV
jgi:2-keto-4-pentenoate hydratase/2-oxohepta-3-ene-1,7-dioic acid hydratase in catechol pathway